MRHLFTRPPDILGPPRSPHRNSLQYLFTRPPWQISMQNSLRSPDIPGPPRSPHRSSLQDLFTRPLRSPGIPGPPRSLHRSSLYKISSQAPNERSLYKSSLRSPVIAGPPRSLNRSSLQDLFTRPLWEISLQELSTRTLHKTSMRDLYTRTLYKISSQDPQMRHLYTRSPDIPTPPRSLHKTSMRDLYTRSPDIPGPLRSPHYKISSKDLDQDPIHRKYREGCADEIKRHRATARAIRHAQTPQRVARAETKNAPGWAPATFHQQNEHRATARATLTTILHTSQNPHVLHISRFPKIDTARRRERASEMDLVKNTFRADEMQIHDLEGNFSPEGLPKKPNASAHTTDLHQMLFPYRKNPIVWPHCLGKKTQKGWLMKSMDFQWFSDPKKNWGSSTMGRWFLEALGPRPSSPRVGTAISSCPTERTSFGTAIFRGVSVKQKSGDLKNAKVGASSQSPKKRCWKK